MLVTVAPELEYSTVLEVVVNVPVMDKGVPEPASVNVSLEISKVVEPAIVSEVTLVLVAVETEVEAVAVTTVPKSCLVETLSVITCAAPLLMHGFPAEPP